MNLNLEKVKNQDKNILFRLLQFYLYEESFINSNEINEEAFFEYPWFNDYFSTTEKDRIAYFIKDEENKLLGFVMINEYLQKLNSGHSIAEFFVLPKHRKKKIGKQAAFKCFEKYKGNWEITPIDGNKGAFIFWKNVISDYTNFNYRFEDNIFIFSNQ